MADTLRRARPALGTLVDIDIDIGGHAGRGSGAVSALDAAFAAVADVQRLMSAHDPRSDVRRLSEAAHRGPLRVDPRTVDVLRLARRLHAASRGLFDVAVGGAMATAGHLPPLDRAGSAGAGTSTGTSTETSAGTTADIRIVADDTVVFTRPLHLDLGGIAKGYAIDAAVAALRSHGVVSGVVNAGGDLRAFGPRTHPVQLRFDGGVRTVARLCDGAFAASCSGAAVHVDPRRGGFAGAGRPARTVAVHAPTAVLADALTKVALLCPATADRLCRALGAAWRSFDPGAAAAQDRAGSAVTAAPSPSRASFHVSAGRGAVRSGALSSIWAPAAP